MSISSLLALLFPHLVALRIDNAFRGDLSIRVTVATTALAAACPSAQSRRGGCTAATAAV
ncbi:hypothetical protein GCM10009799_31010 [Nocardiopsis rhodophaea]|uniref:Uncharacterized protein n=1 Tax=Nocardiopsis rhodophaea TaxID=280238 RepID=A0ABN2T8E6_9ACTN